VASPVGHVLTGLVIHIATARDGNELRSKGRAVLLVGVAVLPDVDLVVSLVDGINHHQKQSHSVGAAAIVALTCLLVGLTRRWPRCGRLALWPLSHLHFHFPYPIFLEVRRALAWEPLRHNIVAGAWDAILLGPILVSIWLRKRRSFSAANYA
jgi:hypothetical protein